MGILVKTQLSFLLHFLIVYLFIFGLFYYVSGVQKYHDIFDIGYFRFFFDIFQILPLITSNKLFNYVHPDNSLFTDYCQSLVPNSNNAKLTVL